jgi:Zn-finger domain-containing protein
MTSKAIERVEKIIASLEGQQVSNSVERIDIADIVGTLKNALEKLEALQTYQTSEDTDYDALWEERKHEIAEYQKSRDAWIRTEIFTHLLKSMATNSNVGTTATSPSTVTTPIVVAQKKA